MKITLIAIAGGSGAGKTWLAERLVAAFGEQAGRISLDDFYHDLTPRPAAERAGVNFDQPQAVDWSTFRHTLTALRRGQPVALPRYDFSTHTRQTEATIWQPRPLVILDGLWLLRRAELRRRYALSLFLDCPENLRLERRQRRDQGERGRSAHEVQSQFQQQVVPMHQRWVAPQAAHADVVLPAAAVAKALPGLIVRIAKLNHCQP